MNVLLWNVRAKNLNGPINALPDVNCDWLIRGVLYCDWLAPKYTAVTLIFS